MARPIHDAINQRHKRGWRWSKRVLKCTVCLYPITVNWISFALSCKPHKVCKSISPTPTPILPPPNIGNNFSLIHQRSSNKACMKLKTISLRRARLLKCVVTNNTFIMDTISRCQTEWEEGIDSNFMFFELEHGNMLLLTYICHTRYPIHVWPVTEQKYGICFELSNKRRNIWSDWSNYIYPHYWYRS